MVVGRRVSPNVLPEPQAEAEAAYVPYEPETEEDLDAQECAAYVTHMPVMRSRLCGIMSYKAAFLRTPRARRRGATRYCCGYLSSAHRVLRMRQNRSTWYYSVVQLLVSALLVMCDEIGGILAFRPVQGFVASFI
jgi:hypothetical protein